MMLEAAPAWPPLLAARGRFGHSATHAHHGMHLVLSLDATLSSRVDAEPDFVESAALITAPDVAHEINMSAGEVLLVFIDPESAVGATLRRTFAGALRRIDAAQRDAIVTTRDPMAIMAREGVQWLANVVAVLGAEPAAISPTMHPAVRRAIAMARATTDESALSLEAIAQGVGVSESRLMHAFTECVGIPLRPYLAWLRVQRAVAAIASGHALTESAIAAGFSDASHMTRTFRRMLGLTPGELRASIVASPYKTNDRA